MKFLAWLRGLFRVDFSRKFDDYLMRKARKDIERRDKEVAAKIANQIPYGR